MSISVQKPRDVSLLSKVTVSLLNTYQKVQNYADGSSSVETLVESPAKPIEGLNLAEDKEPADFPEAYTYAYAAAEADEVVESYDDDDCDLLWRPGDVIDTRYRIVRLLGKGSYGQVVEVVDLETDENLALKIIKNKASFHRQAKVEVKVLERIREKDPDDHHRCVRMIRHFEYRNHLCIVFELLSIDVYTLLAQLNFRGLSIRLVKVYCKQLLKCLAFLDQPGMRVIHCDLKPENILLVDPNNRDSIKVIDFGSSCFENERVFTYVQSRYYRSPEVILGNPYTNAIDMWSLGCVLIELFTGKPLFPGENEAQTLYQIVTCLGMPSSSFLSASAHTKKHFIITSGGTYEPLRAGCAPSLTLDQVIEDHMKGRPACDELAHFKDFLRCAFTIDPRFRMTPSEALNHPFVSGCRI